MNFKLSEYERMLICDCLQFEAYTNRNGGLRTDCYKLIEKLKVD